MRSAARDAEARVLAPPSLFRHHPPSDHSSQRLLQDAADVETHALHLQPLRVLPHPWNHAVHLLRVHGAVPPDPRQPLTYEHPLLILHLTRVLYISPISTRVTYEPRSFTCTTDQLIEPSCRCKDAHTTQACTPRDAVPRHEELQIAHAYKHGIWDGHVPS